MVKKRAAGKGRRSARLRYGWVPDLPDHRDHRYRAPEKLLRTLPRSVDLRDQCPPIYNQHKMQSCVANAIGAAIEFNQKKQQTAQRFRPSRLFIYYNARAARGMIDIDQGAPIRAGIKSVARQGVCPEKFWPYQSKHLRTKPSRKCYRDAARHPVVKYQRLPRDLAHMKACLASGYPFVVGLTVYDSLESKRVQRSGHAPMPHRREKRRGGHAVIAVGYDESTRRFILRNSWGRKWGLCGYFTLPYAYLVDADLSDDLWTLRVVR